MTNVTQEKQAQTVKKVQEVQKQVQVVDEKTKFGTGAHDKSFMVGQKPWYSIGTVLKNAPSVKEGIKLAGLDYKIELKDLVTTDGVPVAQKAVVRTDKNISLGVVSNSYKILQNEDAFEFFEPFVENKLASLDSCGSFFNGRKVFILAKINRNNMVISDEDQVEKYLLLSNAHDGTAAVRVGYTPIRVSCSNTLTMAHNCENSNLIRVYHKGNIAATVKELQETINLIDQSFIATEEQYKKLAEMHVNTGDLQKYVKQVFSVQKLEDLYNNEVAIPDHEIKNVREKLMNRIEEVFETEKVHNRWTMYNAVNYYLNHERGRNVENSYNSIWFQNAKRLDKKAFELAFKI